MKILLRNNDNWLQFLFLHINGFAFFSTRIRFSSSSGKIISFVLIQLFFLWNIFPHVEWHQLNSTPRKRTSFFFLLSKSWENERLEYLWVFDSIIVYIKLLLFIILRINHFYPSFFKWTCHKTRIKIQSPGFQQGESVALKMTVSLQFFPITTSLQNLLPPWSLFETVISISSYLNMTWPLLILTKWYSQGNFS